MRLLFCLILLWPLTGLASAKVVTSIQPLYLITRAILQGVSKPELLIKKEASAHHFGFKPSHLRLLKKADLVIWVDRYFESGFQRLGDILPQETETMEILRDLDLSITNGHFWYSPELLLRVISQIQAKLGRIDPQHASLYSDNANNLSRLILEWRGELHNAMKNRSPRYLLDHDFLGAFEQDMNIKAIATLHNSHDQPGSLKDLQDIENKLLQQSAKCLLINQEPASQLARNIAQKYNLPIYNISPATIKSDGPPEFLQLLRQLGSSLLNCR